jgi:archaellum biogenesis ATPase FlaH
MSGVLDLNQLAGLISDAGQELGQSLERKAGGLRIFDSISSLFTNFELAPVQRFVVQLTRTATSFGGVTTIFIVEEGTVDERTLSNIKYTMDGLLETKEESGHYYTRVASMKWSKFIPNWIELKWQNTSE